jgi:hypothetical protein
MSSRTRHLPALAGATTTLAIAAALATAVLSTGRPTATVPHDRPVRATLPAAWAVPDAASVALVRRVVIRTADATSPTLARCERRRPEGARTASFVRCALPALARLGSSGIQNAMMLVRIAAGGHPPKRCDREIRTLAGTLQLQGTLARATLRDALGGLSWPEVAQESRAVRSLTADTRRLARGRIGCQPR